MTVVFLCVGAAKAGTSWLYRQLSRHPEVHLRSIKELHFFDALENGRVDRELAKHKREQAALLARLAGDGRTPSEEQAKRLKDRADWMDVLEFGADDDTAYIDYLHGEAGNAKVVGDLTPAYALLPEERLSQMARMSRDVRVVYLLRDPVERLWSHVRMIAARRDTDGVVSAKRAGRILERVFSGAEDQISMRSDYAGALSRLVAAVPGGRLLVEVFEDMVSGDGFARICRFLGINVTSPDFAPVHVGQAFDMTREQREKAATWLAPQYAAAEQALGHRPEAWKG